MTVSSKSHCSPLPVSPSLGLPQPVRGLQWILCPCNGSKYSSENSSLISPKSSSSLAGSTFIEIWTWKPAHPDLCLHNLMRPVQMLPSFSKVSNYKGSCLLISKKAWEQGGKGYLCIWQERTEEQGLREIEKTHRAVVLNSQQLGISFPSFFFFELENLISDLWFASWLSCQLIGFCFLISVMGLTCLLLCYGGRKRNL